MPLVFGLDIGTTSIGFAVIDHDVELAAGKIHRLGVRIFPEGRDSKQVPLNQVRRQARLRRRQLRRRRARRQRLGELLSEAGLLPPRKSSEWYETMKSDPYELRKRAFQGEMLTPHEIGRAIYHLAQRRHFKGRDIDEISDDVQPDSDGMDDKKVVSARAKTVQTVNRENTTLGAWLAELGPNARKRGQHLTRKVVEDEFDRVWSLLVPESFRSAIRNAIFFQRPVFWRLNTLGQCPFVPSAPLCPKSSWLSQQRRMLEKLNNVALEGGNQRRLDDEERREILTVLQTQASMTWGSVRRTLARLYRDQGEPGQETRLQFNLEVGGEKRLLGNSVEAKLADIFGRSWADHPHKQELRRSIPDRLWQADYEVVGKQRVIIRSEPDRAARRAEIAQRLAKEFGLSDAQARKIEAIKLPSGWERYSVKALEAVLPLLEKGKRFGELVHAPDWDSWRADTFPDREQPTGNMLDRLPSPSDPEERQRLSALRNPTVVRTRNELRKVVNNLIDMYGKPDIIRVEVARDVGNSKRQREEKKAGIRRQESRREVARNDLHEKGISEPSRSDIEKWLLWEECKHRCPYTGDLISFDALFGKGEFEIEHIWPRSRSFDNSFRNKTLCRRDVNSQKGSQIPYEYFSNDPDEWNIVGNRLSTMRASKGSVGMSNGKIRRFLATSIPDDFTSRQLNDTGYAARQAVSYLKLLWPDIGPKTPVNIQAVSGRVTAQLRRLWKLNNILSSDGEKTRSDHRHHAIDALTVACCHPGMTQRLSHYWQETDAPHAEPPHLSAPWISIRKDAERAVRKIVVSHRVRKKVSGPLHKETVYGDADESESNDRQHVYRNFVWRKNVESLTKADLAEKSKDLWPDQSVRKVVENWVSNRGGGDPKKAFPPYPKRGKNGSEIRKVRLHKRRQIDIMAKVSTGYSDLGENHHIAIYKLPDDNVIHEVVSLLEASRRLQRKESIVRRRRDDNAQFIMSLSHGDSLVLSREGEKRIQVVSGIWTNGQVPMIDHYDAINSTEFRPGAKAIILNDGKKISVDPIGRIRSAND